jgi:hypothetical protein
MASFFKRYPLATLITYAASVLAVLTFLQSAHILTGPAARWVDFAAGLLQVLLTAYAKMHVTPVLSPRDQYGRRLVPAPGQMIIDPQK